MVMQYTVLEYRMFAFEEFHDVIGEFTQTQDYTIQSTSIGTNKGNPLKPKTNKK